MLVPGDSGGDVDRWRPSRCSMSSRVCEGAFLRRGGTSEKLWQAKRQLLSCCSLPARCFARIKKIIGAVPFSCWRTTTIVDYCRAAMGHRQRNSSALPGPQNRAGRRSASTEHHRSHARALRAVIASARWKPALRPTCRLRNRGDVTPARPISTAAIMDACRPLGIAIHDHIIISRAEVASFKTLGLL